ncbi:hypothetical protein A2875_01830 [Candidatus Gottesmanbacteria bacterium RIFCSPHIGHO2_01_FULL_46_14]|uniref:Antitoxin n=2 Tax=Candidatus Gottesmaniibacteriota TaxID=1752720 RepID=A0A1F5ZK21_9BACT|nr:MAG: hypothetical protein A2875_01830 [Candidatus Gottesmanbacteria bacterium RIFCSPHIGHO2_01_FULL_46_14]OGG29771.1 MAG: hypothetical protein A2971_00750 [Candidatus Gottesmanbacteria bacterium RIFCSPLOWO2_01_FULL_46_21]
MKYRNPFKDLKLDREEQEINEAIESGKLQTTPLSSGEINRLKATAKATLEKTRNINIRLSERDVLRLKTKAMEEGIPYQTLAASLLHKYASD